MWKDGSFTTVYAEYAVKSNSMQTKKKRVDYPTDDNKVKFTYFWDVFNKEWKVIVVYCSFKHIVLIFICGFDKDHMGSHTFFLPLYIQFITL